MPRSVRHKLYPEPGAWVLDKTHGLPVIGPPQLPVTKNLTTKQVADEVEYHGLGFCIYSYIFPEKIADKDLAEKWRAARKALVAIVKHLDQEDRKIKLIKRPKARRLNLGSEL